jgi:alpha-glucosidase
MGAHEKSLEECNFPDYTNPAVREWWAGLFKLISDIG